MVLSTDTSYPRGFREQHGVQAAPRFGIAYDPFGDGKTAIRTGFGIVKETAPTYNSYFWSMVSNPPVQIEPNIFYGQMNTLLQRQGLLFPVGSSSIQLKDKVPSIYKYSFGIQREVTKDMSAGRVLCRQRGAAPDSRRQSQRSALRRAFPAAEPGRVRKRAA